MFLVQVIELAYARDYKGKTDTIVIHAISGMQYDLARFHVNPNSDLVVIFTNTDNMEHNFVVTQPEKREVVVNLALQLGDMGATMNYIPQAPEVLFSIGVLAPGDSKTINITTPKEEGVYPYVCTYPGHGTIMYGAMYVGSEEDMPDIESDLNIPEWRRSEKKNELTNNHPHRKNLNSGHPYPLTPPFFYRIFMPHSNPASIAVSLENQFSYCWDTDKCLMRYAWHGGFLDNNPPWTTKGQAMSEIIGTIFYKERNLRPLSIEGNSSNPIIRYKGFKLVQGGYPEMHYTLDGFDVYELIKVNRDGNGINVHYRIPKLTKNLILSFENDSDLRVINSKGEEIAHRKLSFTVGKEFSVVIKLQD